ncbi:E3 ubiquitin-protein ligase TRIM45-like [Saccostrea echinata]|uniref:E3 ubiquitin-protein ligase TRIM45-like n=1 Tax=Saccostrea echinata TaxID=191078 RepID=UPI002A80E28E|nr:E3 ubiquitin-protein ligase TRIM45-like [Saccostrea echinata]
MYCDTCLINLCKACVGEHISDDGSNDHKVVKFQNRNSTPLYPGCKLHHKEKCEMYCNQCDIPICTACIASENHFSHKIVQLLTFYTSRKHKIEKENEERRKNIDTIYNDIASDVQNRLNQIEEIYKNISKAITNHGENWHEAVDKIVRKLTSEVDNMRIEHQDVLKKYLAEINKKILNIEDEIKASCDVLESNDIFLVLNFERRIKEFREFPSKVDASPPQFIPLHCRHELFLKRFRKQSHILIADFDNDCVHIIDQNGLFLCLIDCELRFPSGLCIDRNDNLCVAESNNNKVKIIQYQQ